MSELLSPPCKRYRAVGLLLATLALVAYDAKDLSAQSTSYGLVTGNLPHDWGLRTVQHGAGSIRLNLYWDQAERDGDDVWNWNYINPVISFLDRAQVLGLQVYLTIHRTPAWAVSYCFQLDQGDSLGNPYHPCAPNLDKWQEFLQAVFYNLGDRPNIVFGIWNEPDIDSFLSDDDNATVWKQLWTRANVARANVGKPGLRMGGPDHTGDWGRISYYGTAVSHMLGNGHSGDVVTIHYYTTHPTSLSTLMTYALASSSNRKVWLTEVGDGSVDEGVQTYRLQQFVYNPFNSRGNSRWEKIFLFQMADLLRPNGEPKVALEGFRANAVGSIGSYSTRLRTYNGAYVYAYNGGGGALDATAYWRAPETGLWITDWNGGVLKSGDVVSFMTADQAHKVRALGGGGGGVDAASQSFSYDAYYVWRVAGSGPINPGDQVYLQTLSEHLFCAENGGGWIVNANRTAAGPWERFTVEP